MKKLNLLVIFAIILVFLASCASTPEAEDKSIDLLSVYSVEAPLMFFMSLDHPSVTVPLLNFSPETNDEEFFQSMIEDTDRMIAPLQNIEADLSNLEMIHQGNYDVEYYSQIVPNLSNTVTKNITIEGKTYEWIEISGEGIFQIFFASDELVFMTESTIEKMIHNYHMLRAGKELATTEDILKHKTVLDFFDDTTGSGIFVKDVDLFLQSIDMQIPFDIGYAVAEQKTTEQTNTLRLLLGFDDADTAKSLYQLLLLAQISSDIEVSKPSDTTIIVDNFEFDLSMGEEAISQ